MYQFTSRRANLKVFNKSWAAAAFGDGSTFMPTFHPATYLNMHFQF